MEPQASWETTSSANKWRHSVVNLARSLFLLGSCDASKRMGVKPSPASHSPRRCRIEPLGFQNGPAPGKIGLEALGRARP